MSLLVRNIVRNKKIVKKLSLLTLAAIISSSLTVQTSHAFFSDIFNVCNVYSAYNSAKEKVMSVKRKYDNAKRIAKIATCSAIGFIGYKKVARPISKIIFGDKIKPVIKKIDRGINITLLAGCAAGILFIYDRFVAQERVIDKITQAKDKIIGHVTEKIQDLKDYTNKRFNTTDNKLSEIKEDIKNRFNQTDNKLSKINNKVFNIDQTVTSIKQDSSENNTILKDNHTMLRASFYNKQNLQKSA